MSTPNSLPVFLVVHADNQARLAAKRALEQGQRAQVVVVASPEAALELLAGGISGLAAVLLATELPDFGARAFLDGMNILAPKPRPFVLVFGPNADADALADLVEAGANALIESPVSLRQVVSELVALKQTGHSPGSDALNNGADQRAEGERRRAAGDPNWRDRMIRLASTTRSKNGDFRKNRLMALLAQLDGLAEGRLTQDEADALLAMARNDARTVEQTISSAKLDRDRLDKMFSITEDRLRFPGGQPAPRAVIVHALEDLCELARRSRRGERWSGAFDDLRAGATDLVTRKAAGGVLERYRDRLAQWLSVDVAFLDLVEGDRLQRIAARVVKEPDEFRALDFARLSLLAFLLRQKRLLMDGEHAEVCADALSHLLRGSAANPDEGQARLGQAASSLSEAGELDADDLPPFGEFDSLFAVLDSALQPGSERLAEAKLALRRLKAAGGSVLAARTAAATASARAAAAEAHEQSAAAPAPRPAGSAIHNRLLPRLAADLGLWSAFFDSFDEREVLGQLDRGSLNDVVLAPPTLARVRVLAVVLGMEMESPLRSMLESTLSQRYAEQPEALDGLMQLLARSGSPLARAAMRGALGMPGVPSKAREVLQVLEVEEVTLAVLMLRELDDRGEETAATIEAFVAHLRAHAPGDASGAALIASLERRLARIAGLSGRQPAAA